MEYELVHEIKNLCPNNQMRDIFFLEIETDDPEGYIRSTVKGTIKDLSRTDHEGGSFTIHASVDGIIQTFTFTPV